jgi:hypothetical protein
VDDFSVKYIGKEHVHHLLQVLRQDYEIEEDWEGTRYLGITLDWDYTKREVHLSMPGYVEKALARFSTKSPRNLKTNHTSTQSQCMEPLSNMPKLTTSQDPYPKKRKNISNK